MVEVLIVVGVAGLAFAVMEAMRRAAHRRSLRRAERVLDDLAAAACAALADGGERRTARALARYERTRDRVAVARTRHELELVVARHRLRQGALRMGARTLERARDLIADTVPARR